MAVPPPDPVLVDRFRVDLEALTGGPPERLGVAVSGGPDSLALLLLAHAALPGRVAAATVDHGFRPEAAAEAAFVADLCGRIGVPHAVLTVTVDPKRSSLQRAAREARYAALAGWLDVQGIAWLATAHHADDQAETLLMRLARGSGVGGLAGIRASGPLPAPGATARLVRPLLGWRRAELSALVAAAGLAPVRDPANRDPRFDRTRVRDRLAQAEWIDPIALARSAEALAEAEEALGWMTHGLWDRRVEWTGAREIRFAADGLPPELVRRLLARILAELNPKAAPRGGELRRLAQTLAQGGTTTLGGVRCAAGEHDWRFTPAPPRRAR